MLFAVVVATGAAAIVVGLAESVRPGTVVAEVVAAGAVPFVLMGLVSPGLFRRPRGPAASRRPAAARRRRRSPCRPRPVTAAARRPGQALSR